MANHVLLNNVDHQNIRINTARTAALGDNVMSCVAYANEFRKLQACFPIVFAEDESGQVWSMALLGLEKGENLFLGPSGWDASYIPAALGMQPFLIGYANDMGGERQTVIHMDMDSPRVGEEEGELLFKPMGGNTPFLDQVVELLQHVHAGYSDSPAFIASLKAYDLLEPFVLETDPAQGTSSRLEGFQIINEEKLHALGGEALADLNEKGFLQPIFMAVASLSHFPDLIRRKQARVADRDNSSR